MPRQDLRSLGNFLWALGAWPLRCARKQLPARLRAPSGFAVSLIMHAALLVLLNLIGVWRDAEHGTHGVVLLPFVEDFGPEPFVEEIAAIVTVLPAEVLGAQSGEPVETQLPDAPNILAPLPSLLAGLGQQETASGPQQFTSSNLLAAADAPGGGGFEGRTPTARARLLGQRGGTPASEDAVARGLAWIAAHQRPNGSWWFDHRDGPCGGQCRDPGTVGSTTAATGLALLPFLGAGEIGAGSQYEKVVDDGLYYLRSRILITALGGDLQEGTMYAQGIAAITLCEAYAMTGDESLRSAAQLAIDFICRAQHEAGGWRYYPGQPGDTTVFGWQLMALKSARLAGLEVPSETFARAERFLDSVQNDDGAVYGYQKPDKSPTPTAVGLLSRMYLGWRRSDSRLGRGVSYLEKLGPSRTDMYFNYYATQVLHHYESPGWDRWNTALRDRLVATQSRRGHEHGSWYFHDPHGKSGGRLYTTAICVMILEVYYRHMPLYGKRAVEADL
ncbi:MAG: terpene cyclase/mutase family protein [Candidatus Anammoximicrobium sp.]|nr:terpene cyclase/mutase family protein [Candidatus Anammoximicrobium sp.]